MICAWSRPRFQANRTAARVFRRERNSAGALLACRESRSARTKALPASRRSVAHGPDSAVHRIQTRGCGERKQCLLCATPYRFLGGLDPHSMARPLYALAPSRRKRAFAPEWGANDLSPMSSCPRKAPTGSSLGILGCRDDHQEFQSDPTPEPHHARALAPEADDRSFRQTASDQFVLVARRHFSLGLGGGVSTCTAGTDFR